MAESELRPPHGGLLTDGRFLFAVTAVACILSCLGPVTSYDVWWHMEAGRTILATGKVPHADVYSFTALGRPWVYQSWLAATALAGAWRAGGTVGLVMFQAIMLTAGVMVAWVLARRRGVDAGLASVFALAACLQLGTLEQARPFLFSFVMFGVFAGMLHATCARSTEGDGTRARYWLWGPGGRLALLPPLTLLWANLHAGFLVGMVLLGAYGAGEMVRLAVARGGRPYLRLLLREGEGARFRAMFGVGVASLLASLVTPYGPGVLLYTYKVLGTVKTVKHIQEWRATPLTGEYVVFWGLLAMGAVILVRSIRSTVREGRLRAVAGPLVTDVLLFAGFAIMAVRSVRHLAWVMLLAPSILGYHFSVARGVPVAARRRLAYAGAALALAAVVATSPLIRERGALGSISENSIPVKACDFIAVNGLYYRPFNSYQWGGYLIHRFWPRMHVFVDGRTDVYGDQILDPYRRIAAGREGWRDLLAPFDVQMLLVDYRRAPTRHFFEDRRWRCVYWDDLAIVALRDDVLAAERQGLAEFRLSNPAVFTLSLADAPVGDIMAELDAVLARDPKCWTALSFRSRCLVRLAREQPERRSELLKQAAEVLRQSMDLEDEQAAPWRAAADLERALGNAKLADKYEHKADVFALRRK